MAFRVQTEPHIEVHKYPWPVVAGVAFMAVAVRAFVPKYFASAELLDLPLLVTLYFALSRRNPATGLFLGMSIGLLQDAVSRVPIGLNGIAKTLVGYIGSTIGARLDVEHPISRFFLTFCFYHFHQVILELVRRVLLAKPEVFFSVRSLEASLLTALLAVGLFPLLDKLRTPN